MERVPSQGQPPVGTLEQKVKWLIDEVERIKRASARPTLATEITGDFPSISVTGTATFGGAVTFEGAVEFEVTTTFGGAATFGSTVTISGNQPILHFYELDAATDEKWWRVTTASGNFFLFAINDALSGSTQTLRIDRSGLTIDKWTIDATLVEFNANVEVDGTLDIDGAADVSGVMSKNGTTVYRLIDIDILTGSGTYTVPTGATALFIEMWGAGGGGGGATGGASQCSLSSGGGGGEYAARWLVGLGASYAYVCATGGAGGAAAATPVSGSAGSGNTTMGGFAAGPGQGGLVLTTGTSVTLREGGAGGDGGTTGDQHIRGQSGGMGLRLSGTIGIAGVGGGPGGGPVGDTNGVTANGVAGDLGGGGSGAQSFTTAQRAGGAGGNGYIRVWAFG